MITKYTKVVEDTIKSTGEKEEIVKTVLKHFFRQLRKLMKSKISFKEAKMFHIYHKKRKKVK